MHLEQALAKASEFLRLKHRLSIKLFTTWIVSGMQLAASILKKVKPNPQFLFDSARILESSNSSSVFIEVRSTSLFSSSGLSVQVALFAV